MEIEVGEYVRTYFGEIGKCIDKSFESCIIDFNKEEYDEFFEDEFEEEIYKHSKNIIELLEDTDILQVEISEEWVIKEDTIRFIIVGQTYTIDEIKEALENAMYKIKKILTHEQFEQNVFRLEE